MTTKDPLNQDPITGETGSHPVGTGVGAVGGALAGATLGAIGGPIGSMAGAAIGAIAGAMAGKEVGETVNPTLGGDHEDHLVGEGVGASSGVLVGGALGAVGGPIGMAAGAAIGAIVGGVAGEKVDELVNPTEEELIANGVRDDDDVVIVHNVPNLQDLPDTTIVHSEFTSIRHEPTPLEFGSTTLHEPIVTHEPTQEAINRVNHIDEEHVKKDDLV